MDDETHTHELDAFVIMQVGLTSSPDEWRYKRLAKDQRPFDGGKQHRVWQLRSKYQLVGVDMAGLKITRVANR